MPLAASAAIVDHVVVVRVAQLEPGRAHPQVEQRPVRMSHVPVWAYPGAPPFIYAGVA